MTKDKIDALLKGLDTLGLGVDGGNVVREPRSAQNGTVPVSVFRLSSFDPALNSPPVPWNVSKTSSRSYLTRWRTWDE